MIGEVLRVPACCAANRMFLAPTPVRRGVAFQGVRVCAFGVGCGVRCVGV